VLAEPPEAVGVVEKVLKVILAPGLFIVEIKVAPPKFELFDR
jgi:hypothetical protein